MDSNVEDIRRDLAVVVSRVDRHEVDITTMTGSLNSLRERMDYQHTAVMAKVEASLSNGASIKSWLIGLGVGIPVGWEVLNFLVSSGLLRHL